MCQNDKGTSWLCLHLRITALAGCARRRCPLWISKKQNFRLSGGYKHLLGAPRDGQTFNWCRARALPAPRRAPGTGGLVWLAVWACLCPPHACDSQETESLSLASAALSTRQGTRLVLTKY